MFPKFDATSPPRVGIAGFGTVGKSVGKALMCDSSLGILSGITSGQSVKAHAAAQELGIGVPIVSIGELIELSDVIVEVAPASAFRSIIEPSLNSSRTIVVCSTVGLALAPDLIELAEKTGGRILVPSCSIPGIDGIFAAAQGEIISVRLITRKPLASLPSERVKISDAAPDEAVCLFSGFAREAIEMFPANLNVAATISIAGIGIDRTYVEIWADPKVNRNTHRLEVDSDSTRFSVDVANIPDKLSPRTGLLTANGVIALLRKIAQSARFGI